MQIAAGQFKARCLKLMDDVQKSHETLVITKFGKPVAKLIAFGIKNPKFKIFGFLKGSLVMSGDVVKPLDVQWSANA